MEPTQNQWTAQQQRTVNLFLASEAKTILKRIKAATDKIEAEISKCFTEEERNNPESSYSALESICEALKNRKFTDFADKQRELVGDKGLISVRIRELTEQIKQNQEKSELNAMCNKMLDMLLRLDGLWPSKIQTLPINQQMNRINNAIMLSWYGLPFHVDDQGRLYVRGDGDEIFFEDTEAFKRVVREILKDPNREEFREKMRKLYRKNPVTVEEFIVGLYAICESHTCAVCLKQEEDDIHHVGLIVARKIPDVLNALKSILKEEGYKKFLEEICNSPDTEIGIKWRKILGDNYDELNKLLQVNGMGITKALRFYVRRQQVLEYVQEEYQKLYPKEAKNGFSGEMSIVEQSRREVNPLINDSKEEKKSINNTQEVNRPSTPPADPGDVKLYLRKEGYDPDDNPDDDPNALIKTVKIERSVRESFHQNSIDVKDPIPWEGQNLNQEGGQGGVVNLVRENLPHGGFEDLIKKNPGQVGFVRSGSLVRDSEHQQPDYVDPIIKDTQEMPECFAGGGYPDKDAKDNRFVQELIATYYKLKKLYKESSETTDEMRKLVWKLEWARKIVTFKYPVLEGRKFSFTADEYKRYDEYALLNNAFIYLQGKGIERSAGVNTLSIVARNTAALTVASNGTHINLAKNTVLKQYLQYLAGILNKNFNSNNNTTPMGELLTLIGCNANLTGDKNIKTVLDELDDVRNELGLERSDSKNRGGDDRIRFLLQQKRNGVGDDKITDIATRALEYNERQFVCRGALGTNVQKDVREFIDSNKLLREKIPNRPESEKIADIVGDMDALILYILERANKDQAIENDLLMKFALGFMSMVVQLQERYINCPSEENYKLLLSVVEKYCCLAGIADLPLDFIESIIKELIPETNEGKNAAFPFLRKFIGRNKDFDVTRSTQEINENSDTIARMRAVDHAKALYASGKVHALTEEDHKKITSIEKCLKPLTDAVKYQTSFNEALARHQLRDEVKPIASALRRSCQAMLPALLAVDKVPDKLGKGPDIVYTSDTTENIQIVSGLLGDVPFGIGSALQKVLGFVENISVSIDAATQEKYIRALRKFFAETDDNPSELGYFILSTLLDTDVGIGLFRHVLDPKTSLGQSDMKDIERAVKVVLDTAQGKVDHLIKGFNGDFDLPPDNVSDKIDAFTVELMKQIADHLVKNPRKQEQTYKEYLKTFFNSPGFNEGMCKAVNMPIKVTEAQKDADIQRSLSEMRDKINDYRQQNGHQGIGDIASNEIKGTGAPVLTFANLWRASSATIPIIIAAAQATATEFGEDITVTKSGSFFRRTYTLEITLPAGCSKDRLKAFLEKMNGKIAEKIEEKKKPLLSRCCPCIGKKASAIKGRTYLKGESYIRELSVKSPQTEALQQSGEIRIERVYHDNRSPQV